MFALNALYTCEDTKKPDLVLFIYFKLPLWSFSFWWQIFNANFLHCWIFPVGQVWRLV